MHDFRNMKNKPTIDQINFILKGLKNDLIDSFKYRLRDGSIVPIDDFKKRLIPSRVISAFAPDKVAFLVYNTVENEICYRFVYDEMILHKYSDYLNYQELKALQLVDENEEIVEIVTPINKAKDLQSDLNILLKKTVEALNPELEKIYKQIGHYFSVLKYSKNIAIGFAAASLVPLLYSGIRTFASKSNQSTLPFFACCSTLLCLSGLTLAIRHYLDKDISNIISSNINVSFSQQDLASKLLSSLDESHNVNR